MSNDLKTSTTYPYREPEGVGYIVAYSYVLLRFIYQELTEPGGLALSQLFLTLCSLPMDLSAREIQFLERRVARDRAIKASQLFEDYDEPPLDWTLFEQKMQYRYYS